MNFFLAWDHMALWSVIGATIIAYVMKQFFASNPNPRLSFSFIKNLRPPQPSTRVRLSILPKRLYQGALLFFIIAFIDPHLMLKRKSDSSNNQFPPTEGIAIYLDLDQSGSMSEKVVATDSEGHKKVMPKIDLMKQVAEQFIRSRPTDLIGIVAFARIPHILAPLTLDQDALIEQLKQIQIVQQPNLDGTGIGYAIFKTANLIAATRHFAAELKNNRQATYNLKSATIIVVTDGLQDPNPLDKGNRLRTIELEDAATYAKSEGVHLYIVNIDPRFASEEFAPHRRLMKRITEMTGGKFYLVGEQGLDLQQIFADIDQIEKETLPSTNETVVNSKDYLDEHYRRFSFFPFLIALGLLCLFSAIVLDTIYLRRVP